MLKRKSLLVFILPSDWTHTYSRPCSLEWKWLDNKLVDLFFAEGDKRNNVFKQFLEEGFVGLVWYDENDWASYAWMSLPKTVGPAHLPRSIRKLPVYWIFYCRTKDKYQGQGLFKASLSLLARWARERDPEADVYIDTEPGNIPSKQAIKAVGFLPKGIITTWTLRIPRLRLIIWGRWDPNAPHPKKGSQ